MTAKRNCVSCKYLHQNKELKPCDCCFESDGWMSASRGTLRKRMEYISEILKEVEEWK